MLIFPLKKEWYEKIKSGEKTVEYRELKPYWNGRLSKEFDFDQNAFCNIGDILAMLTYRHPIKLRLGYTKKYMEALVNKIEIVNGKDTDLHIDKPVYAIHLDDVKEVKGNEKNRTSVIQVQ